MSAIIHDIRYSLRILAKSPGFAVVAVLALALGIGANTTIFTFVNATLFRSPAVRNPESLAVVWSLNQGRGAQDQVVSLPDFADWKEQSRAFEGLAACYGATWNMAGTETPERVSGYAVTDGFFQVLGAEPALGRVFRPEEGGVGGEPVAVLSDRLWKRDFEAQAGVLNRSIQLDGKRYSVIGVMPPQFAFPGGAELWTPLALDTGRSDRGRRFLFAVGRLKPEVSAAQAQMDLDSIARRLETAYPDTNQGWAVHVMSFSDMQVSGGARQVLMLLLSVVAFVLLITCANLANLQLARSEVRHKEMAIRAAIGAERRRLLRQLLTESALLSLAGGLVGLMLTYLVGELLRSRYASIIPVLEEVSIDGRVLAFTLTLSLLTAVIFGLLPAWQASRHNLQAALQEGGRSSSSAGRWGVRKLLVVGEFSMALMLLVTAGLMIRTLIAFQQVEAGFDSSNLLTLRISLTESEYPQSQRIAEFYDQVRQRVGSLPQVQAVGSIDRLPLAGSKYNPHNAVTIEGYQTGNEGEGPWAGEATASPGYFEAMGISLISGRLFTAQDSAESEPLCIVSQAMAKRYWPQGSPLDKRVKLGAAASDLPWRRIVGVVGDVRNDDVDQPPVPQIYLPHSQNPLASMSLAVRTLGDPLQVASSVQSSVWSVDRSQPVYEIKTMERILFEDLAGTRILVELLQNFALLALLLAALGIYSVTSFSVSHRTQEIGVRLAFGSRPRDVLKLVVGQGLKLITAGVVVGLLGALALGRIMASLLYNVSPTDPVTFISVMLLLTLVGVAACYIPARRASRLDPAVALRSQ